MVRHPGFRLALRSVTVLFLISLFILGCQQSNRGTTVPNTNNGFNSNFTGDLLGGGGSLTPSPTVPESESGNLPGLPGLSENNANSENPANLPQGTDLGSYLSQFQQAWQSIFNRQTPFDPRSLPELGQNAFRDWFCRAAALNGLRALYGGTSVAEFVADLYVRVLRRAPDTPGLHHHVGDLAAGRTTVRQKVRQFILSDEHLNGHVITANWRHFLGRDPNASELNHWRVNKLQRHDDQLHDPFDAHARLHTLEGFMAHLAGSPEFYRNRSANRPRRQVINMYRYFLGRIPAEWEIRAWLNQRNPLYRGDRLSNHTIRVNMAIAFVTSDEYRLVWIHRAFRDLLGRDPSGAEVQATLARLRGGSDMFREMTTLLASAPYMQRVNALWGAFYSQQYCSQQNN